MKIVINKCFGGFGLSPRAVKRLAELNGKPCYFFTTDHKTGKHTPASMKEISGSLFWCAYTVPNPDEVAGSQSEWASLSIEERKASNARWSEITLGTRPENRTDPLLIQVVQELGDKADGDFAELRVIEIPDGIEWEIDEYDGMEKVNEKHQSWS